jgi:hypothetical protein
MKVKTSGYQPILVENPKTGEMVNVEPIIELLNLIGEGKMCVIGNELDIAIKYVALSNGSEVLLNKVDILHSLYEIRDAFNNAS